MKNIQSNSPMTNKYFGVNGEYFVVDYIPYKLHSERLSELNLKNLM